MKLFLSRSSFSLAVVVGALIAGAIALWPRAEPPTFYFQMTIRATLPGFARLYHGIGSGAKEADSIRLPIEGGNRDADYKFSLPEGRYLNLRFDPTDRAGNTMTLSRACIVDRAGNLIRPLPPGQIKPSAQIEQLHASESEVTLTTAATADRPSLSLALGPPLLLKNYAKPSARTLMRRFLIFLVPCAALSLFLVSVLSSGIKSGIGGLSRKLAVRGRAHPSQLLLSAAAASVILSCYPIVFFGKSFLSPNNHSHACLLYGEMPTVPGSHEVGTDNEQGSDLGAAIWYSWPTSVVESRALFKYCELPLWNRYDSAGLPLLGQGQSMFGDPLHLLPLLTGGSSGWWDLKYLLAKFAFAVCLGFCVLQLTKHLPAAAIISLTAPFIGFFSYRYSHPAFFSMCYAPAILLCWFKLIDAREARRATLWLGLMLLANWAVINSGTVKEAYVLLLAMNLCGLLTLSLASGVSNKAAKLRQAICAQALFVLIAAPVWLSFLDTLRISWTYSDIGAAYQIQPSLLIGLFDDIFYRQLHVSNQHLHPAANFLVLAGVLWFCLSRRGTDDRKLARGLIFTCLLALAIVFMLVPPSWITRIPFIGRIAHVDNTFSCVAIICLLVLAGFGIRAFWNDCQSAAFKRIYFRLLLSLAGLLVLYLGTTKARSNFFWGYSLVLIAAFAGAPWIMRLVLRSGRARTWQVFSLGLILVFLHWRHGMHLTTPFDAYVMNPHQRADLVADASPALELIRNSTSEPFRSAGSGYNLFPGYGGAIGVEQIDSAAPLLNKHYKSLMDATGIQLPFGSSHEGAIGQHLERDLAIFDMLNVRYFLGDVEFVAEGARSLKKIAALDLNVYESSKVWPRAFFTDGLVASSSEDDFVALLRTGDGRPFAAISPAELDRRSEPRSPDPSRFAVRQIVPATEYALTNNKTSFKIAAPGKGVVVLTEPYVESDFKLRVNGKPTSYFRVNSAFRGVFLPAAGDYHFSFSYWPRHLTLSLWISGFGILLLLLWIGSAFKHSDRQA